MGITNFFINEGEFWPAEVSPLDLCRLDGNLQDWLASRKYETQPESS